MHSGIRQTAVENLVVCCARSLEAVLAIDDPAEAFIHRVLVMRGDELVSTRDVIRGRG